MITDSQTNFLYLSDVLPKKYPDFYKRFEKLLHSCNINFDLLPKTKDVWAVDYMPIQVNEKRFVQFRYEPDYLREYLYLRTYPKDVLRAINLQAEISSINLDGGNVVKFNDKAIICDKVFHENKKLSDKEVIKELKRILEIDKLIFVPWDNDDFTGHADGMVRFIDNETVLINERSKYINTIFQTSLRMSLHNAGIEYKELPYNVPDDPTGVSARGLYLNYLQMEEIIIMPIFHLKTDDKAYNVFSECFNQQRIETIDCSEIARDGGVLNCISWNIKK
jgi:agmatine deiminase